MSRQPFAPIRQRNPGGEIKVGNTALEQYPKLEELIGRCVMAWPPAEAEMALFLGYLLGANNNAAALAVFQSLRRSSAQRDAISEAAKVTINSTDQELLAAALNVHKSIEAERNAISHGHFGTYSKLPNALLWMTTNDYVELKATLSLVRATFTPELAKKSYARMYVYKADDFEQIYKNIQYIGWVWTDLTNYLRADHFARAELYDRLCNQARIAQALATLRQKNTPPSLPG